MRNNNPEDLQAIEQQQSIADPKEVPSTVEHRFSDHQEVSEFSLSEDPLLEGLLLFCDLYARTASATQLTAGLPLDHNGRLTPALLERAGARVDLVVSVRSGQDIRRIPNGLLPVMLMLQDGSVVLLTERRGNCCTLLATQLPKKPFEMELAELKSLHSGDVVFCTPAPRLEERDTAFSVQSGTRHWFWSEVSRYKWHFVEIAGAAALTNILALCTSLFSRQVFDRVVPNQAFATLWVLVVGVLIAIALELVIRLTRSYLVDIVGKRLDLGLSSRIFEQALGLRLERRPKSTGSFVNQVRECDTVREFFTSTTIAAVSDLPFVFLFIGVIWLIGGPIAYVQIAAIPMIIIPGLLAQPALSKFSRRHLRESSIRNGLLIEAMTGAETVKSLRAEGRFQRLWEEYAVLLASNSTSTRALTNGLSYVASSVQQLAYIMLMVVGVYLISTGELTSGGLLAC